METPDRLSRSRLLKDTTYDPSFDKNLCDDRVGFGSSYRIFNYTRHCLELLDIHGRVVEFIEPIPNDILDDPKRVNNSKKHGRSNAGASFSGIYGAGIESTPREVVNIIFRQNCRNSANTGHAQVERKRKSYSPRDFSELGYVYIEELHLFLRYINPERPMPRPKSIQEWVAENMCPGEAVARTAPNYRTTGDVVCGSGLMILYNTPHVYSEFLYTTDNCTVMYGPCVRCPYLLEGEIRLVGNVYVGRSKVLINEPISYAQFQVDEDKVIRFRGHDKWIGTITVAFSGELLDKYLAKELEAERQAEEREHRARVERGETITIDDVPAEVRKEIIKLAAEASDHDHLPGIIVDIIDHTERVTHNEAEDRISEVTTEFNEKINSLEEKITIRDEELVSVNEELTIKNNILKRSTRTKKEQESLLEESVSDAQKKRAERRANDEEATASTRRRMEGIKLIQAALLVGHQIHNLFGPPVIKLARFLFRFLQSGLIRPV